jgi:cell division protein FtsI/penicillin-binding protein 2
MTRRTLLVSALAAKDCVVAMRVEDGKVLRADNPVAARTRLLAPGSAAKPLVLAALRRRDRVRCASRLTVNGRRLDCVHPAVPEPLDAEAALALSCNSWFAAMARLADPRLVLDTLRRAGAEAGLATSTEALQLQVLGLEQVRFSPLALAEAYRRLARDAEPMVRAGLRRAASEGTAQLAGLDGLNVAGKTGTTSAASWFAGYAPAEAPRVVVVVQLLGGHGGTDAAPLAREVFLRWRDSQ